MDVSEKKQKTTEQIIRLYVSTILVLWNSICKDYNKKIDEEKEELEIKRLEKSDKGNINALQISLIEDEELEIGDIAKEKKQELEQLSNTRYKNVYNDFQKCEKELKDDLKLIQKEINMIYDECEQKINTNAEKNKLNESEKRELAASIDIDLKQIENLIENGFDKIDTTEDPLATLEVEKKTKVLIIIKK